MNEREQPAMEMSDTMFCGQCGARVPASARFCLDCGAPQAPEPDERTDAGPSARVPPRVAERVERVAPGAGELAGELAQRLQAPGAVAAATVGGFALLTCLAVGLVTAIVTPDRTAIGAPHAGTGIVTETVRLTIATTLAHVKAVDGVSGLRFLPLIFGAAPVLGAALGARRAAPSLTGMSTRAAVAWSSAGAIVFAVGMLVLALVANGQAPTHGLDLDVSLGSVLFLSLLTAGAGAAFGALRAARRVAPDRPGIELSAVAAGWLRTAATPLVGLGALLCVATLVGFVHYEVQTVRGQATAVGPMRSDLAAGIENVLLAPDIGIETAGLAMVAQFRDSVLPVDDDKVDELAESIGGGKGRIFDYSAALPPYVFLPELLVLLGAVVVCGVYAGFATTRRAAPRTQLVAASWGMSTGVVWAFALALLRTLDYGRVTAGDSVFANALLIGAVTGAIGGVLAFRPARTAASPAPEVLHG